MDNPRRSTVRFGLGRTTKGDGRRAAKAGKVAAICMAALSMFAVSLVFGAAPAQAGGPPYSGPQTTTQSPAYFGPAPNPVPYCESPTYFDPFPANVDAIGSINPGTDYSVTTNGVTMTFRMLREGAANEKYPGFFDGTDRPKGVEMQAGDVAEVELSEPMFYSQWVFTDVDRKNEGFTVTPHWVGGSSGSLAVFGGDEDFTFAGTDTKAAAFNDTDKEAEASHDIEGRVQVDFIGAVEGIGMVRDVGDGQSGFAVGGGCAPIGVAKALVDGPTWNSAEGVFEVTYEFNVRNNLPSDETLTADIAAALAAARSGIEVGPHEGIDMTGIQLSDILVDPAFSSVEVVSLTNQTEAGNPNTGLALNGNYDGDSDTQLLAEGQVIPPETEAKFELVLKYTPAEAGPVGNTCSASYRLENSAVASGTAAGVQVQDESDEGFEPNPGDNNGGGGVDDPTIVTFDCPPVALEIVKTAVPGPDADCPDFDSGVSGEGDALEVVDGDTVTYCVTVRNTAPVDATDVVITDDMAPAPIAVGRVPAGTDHTEFYDVVMNLGDVDGDGQIVNIAYANGNGPDGALDEISDPAVVAVVEQAGPVLEIVKTVVPGPDGDCPTTFDAGILGAGDPLVVTDSDIVTYCMIVRNTGSGDATNVVVTDAMAPDSWDGTVGDLAAGAGFQLDSFDIAADLGAVDADSTITNTATVNGDGPYGPVPADSDPAVVEVAPIPDPVLEIVKTVVPGPDGDCPITFDAGILGAGAPLVVTDSDIVTYCMIVRNAGGDATNVVVTDPMAPSPWSGDVGDLAAGAEVQLDSFDVAADLDAVDADSTITNTATVNGDGPYGPMDPDTDPAVIQVDPIPDPGLEIVKTAVKGPDGDCPGFFVDGVLGDGDPVELIDGETVTYCVIVRNTGETDAANVVVSDEQAPDGWDGHVGDLAAGDEYVLDAYDVTVDLTTDTTNTATAAGDGPYGALDPVDDTAVILVDPKPAPVLEIVKTVVLGPGGDCPAFGDGVPGDGDPFLLTDGNVVTFCMTVRNVGEGPATDVVVTDGQAPDGWDGTIGDLAPGAEDTVSFDIKVDLETPERNVATAVGTGPYEDTDPVDDSAVIDVSPKPVPRIEISKTVIPLGENCADAVEGIDEELVAEPGDEVTWCIEIANVGETALGDIVFNDDLAGVTDLDVLSEWGDDRPALVPGDSITAEITTTVEDGGFHNVADVTGVPTEDDGVPIEEPHVDSVSDENDAQVIDTSLELDKKVELGEDLSCEDASDELIVSLDSVVTYCFTVTNTGSIDVLVTEVVDETLDMTLPIPEADQILAPGESVTTGVTVAATTLTNVANVVGTPVGPEGEPIPDAPNPEAEDEVPLTELNSVLDIVKTVVPGPDGECPTYMAGVEGEGEALPVQIGDTVTYCLSVANVGDTVVNNVVITDDQAPEDFDGAVGSLEPSRGATRSFDVVVGGDTEARNTGVANGTDPLDNPVEPPDDVSLIDIDPPNPQVDLAKTVIPFGESCEAAVQGEDELLVASEGDAITWCFTVTNVGNVPLANVIFDDGPANIVGVDLLETYTDKTVLLVGESIEFSVDGVIPPGGLDNVALVTGEAAEVTGAVLVGVDPVDDTDDAAINEVAIELDKRIAPGDDADCEGAVDQLDINQGDVVTYCFTVTNNGGVDMLVAEVVDTTLEVVVPIRVDDQILAPGESVTVKVSLPAADDLVNLASVVAVAVDENGDPIPGVPQVTDQDDAVVKTLASDLSVDKQVDPTGPVSAGTTVTYTVTVVNEGPDPAEHVYFVDTLPAGLEFESVPDVDGWECDTEDRELRCEADEAVPVDAEIEFSYDVTVTSAAAAGVDLVNTVEVTSSTPDPDPENNVDTENTRRRPPVVYRPPTVVVDPPDEVLPVVEVPLAVTGSTSRPVVAGGLGLMGLGGLLLIGVRHRNRDKN